MIVGAGIAGIVGHYVAIIVTAALLCGFALIAVSEIFQRQQKES
jgi:hypothetical protein